MSADSDKFDHLDGIGRHVAAIARRPRWAVYLVVGFSVALAWTVLAGMARNAAALAGPGGSVGDDLLLWLPDLPLPEVFQNFIQLCLSPTSAPSGTEFWVLLAMWVLMSVAMMLPSAAPMICTYCEVADTAAAKGARVVHPFILVAGYISIWVLASVLFAAATVIAQRFSTSGVPLQPPPLWIGGTVLVLAGAYQFSGLKEACLKKCRRPFSVLFARWTAKSSGVFRLGAEQGIWCLGCCYALMLVMFAVGIMNIFWMAMIGLFTVFEKQATGRLSSWLAGAILLFWGAGLLVLSARG